MGGWVRLGVFGGCGLGCGTNKLQRLFVLEDFAHILVSDDKIKQCWPSSPPMSSLDASSTASASAHHSAA